MATAEEEDARREELRAQHATLQDALPEQEATTELGSTYGKRSTIRLPEDEGGEAAGDDGLPFGRGGNRPRRLRGTYRKVEKKVPLAKVYTPPKAVDEKGRLRNAESVGRERESRDTRSLAENRGKWPETFATKAHEGPWKKGHINMYSNNGMHPNKRSYFDRWLDPRDPADPPIKGLKPEWQLQTGAVEHAQREKAKGLVAHFMPTHRHPSQPPGHTTWAPGADWGPPPDGQWLCQGPPPGADQAEPSTKPSRGERRERRCSRRTPWTERPIGLPWAEEASAPEDWGEEDSEPEEPEETEEAEEELPPPASPGSALGASHRMLPEPRVSPGGAGHGNRLEETLRLGESSPDAVPLGVSFFDAGSKDLMNTELRSPEAKKWDSHHHITWCNEQNIGNPKKLNSANLRNYFARPRNPQVGARGAEVYTYGELEPMDGSPESPKRQTRVISRVIPNWRLEPNRAMALGAPLPSAEELKVRKDPLRPKQGTGGNAFSMAGQLHLNRSSSAGQPLGGLSGSTATVGSASSPSLDWRVDKDSRLPVSSGDRRRQGRWNHRHNVVFKNEDVSRLDRNYFDRPREPEAMLPPKVEDREALGGVHTWSLEHSGNPAEEAEKITRAGDKRFTEDGGWDYAHHRLFSNVIQANARSYFDRFRDFPNQSLDGRQMLMLTDTTREDSAKEAAKAPSQWGTLLADSRKRGKLTPDQQLPVKWRLNQGGGPGSGTRTLKERTSWQDTFREPPKEEPKAIKVKEKRRAAWFTSHGVIF